MYGKIATICMLLLSAHALVEAKTWEKGLPIQLGADDWDEMLKGEWLVKFYAPWCPACRNLDSIWRNIAGWCTDVNIRIGQVDVTDNPGLTGRFMVKTLPTIYHVKDGVFRQYSGLRDEYELISFLDDKKWDQIKPLPWYRTPTSFPMICMGKFFDVAIQGRDLHDKMVKQYGFPIWMSYTIFAGVTTIMGFTVGLIVVYVCDRIFEKMFPANTPHILSQLLWTQRMHDIGAGGDTKGLSEHGSAGGDVTVSEADTPPDDSDNCLSNNYGPRRRLNRLSSQQDDQL